MWRITLTGVALLVFQVLGASTAEAGCGDYVLVNGHLATHHAQAFPQSGTTPAEDLPLTPCQQGRCSRNDRPASLPLPTVIPLANDQWGTLLTKVSIVSCGENWSRWNLATKVTPLHIADPLLRPPRAVLA